MVLYTILIEYDNNVNFRQHVTICANNISDLVHLVENNYFSESGEPAKIIDIVNQQFA